MLGSRHWRSVLLGCLVMLPLTRPSRACQPPPPGPQISVRGVNLDYPIPADGALVFEVDCWSGCTACEAAELRLDIVVRDAASREVPGEKPEQVFSSDHATKHLVIWRPATQFRSGETYTVQARVHGKTGGLAEVIHCVDALTGVQLDALVLPSFATHRVERGTLYHCPVNLENICPFPQTHEFGSEYQLFPALLLAVGPNAGDPLAGQLLYRIEHHDANGSHYFRGWRSTADARTDLVRFAEVGPRYCSEVQVQSLIGSGDFISQAACAVHGDLETPTPMPTDLESELSSCETPPADLQEQWCAQKMPCDAPYSLTCMRIDEYCGPAPRSGSPSRPADETILADFQPVDHCENPRDPYAGINEVAGCTCRSAGPSGQTGLVNALIFVIIALASWSRRLAAGRAVPVGAAEQFCGGRVKWPRQRSTLMTND